MKEVPPQRIGGLARVAQRRRQNAARNRRIARLRRQGVPVKEIAEAEGLTRQAVYDVLRARVAA